MKIIFLIAILTFIAFPTGRGGISPPQAALTVKVLDEFAQPIAGARISIRAADKDNIQKQNGKSDQNGTFTGQMPSFGFLNYSTGCEGYYSSWGVYRFKRGAMNGDITEWANRQWEPWNPTVEVVLKKKGNPIPMYAKRIDIVPPVADGTAIGFDFIEGDWLTPYGKGKVADLIFSGTGTFEKGDYKVMWTFTNVGDGIQVHLYDGGPRSQLASPAKAPIDGYLPHVTVDGEGRIPGQPGNDRPLCFTFRVRTVVDNAGKVITAHYGKIYTAGYRFVYYFNPIQNSRVLEFDVKHNLFNDLKFTGPINDP
ncbi:MAG TPA: hypothetical protein VIT91_09710 [Chthoniobacterales bacterium]